MLTNLGDQIPYGEVRAVTSPEELKLLRALIGALASLVYRLLLLLLLPQEKNPEAGSRARRGSRVPESIPEIPP